MICIMQACFVAALLHEIATFYKSYEEYRCNETMIFSSDHIFWLKMQSISFWETVS